MCKIQMRPDRVYRNDVLETLSNDSGSKKGKKETKDNLFCILVLKKLPHNKKLFTLNERATL